MGVEATVVWDQSKLHEISGGGLKIIIVGFEPKNKNISTNLESCITVSVGR
jgi:hypothetical protein